VQAGRAEAKSGARELVVPGLGLASLMFTTYMTTGEGGRWWWALGGGLAASTGRPEI
jgi:hypothetical protein